MADRNPSPTVLIVDDDPLIRLTLSAALESRGYIAEAVADPADAPRGADAVLLDAQLPGCSLNESIALLGHRADGRPRPILVMSGSPSRPAELAGSDIPFLAKPIGLAEFFHAVEALLEAHPAPQTPEAVTEDHER